MIAYRRPARSADHIGRKLSSCRTNALAPGDTIVVAGATGGVGQLSVQKLLERGFKVKAITRSESKANSILGGSELLEIVEADLKDAQGLSDLGVFKGCDGALICTGTTAFPTARWDGNNGPKQTDLISTQNLISAMPSSLKHVSLCTSVGVTRADSFPFCIINTFGVMTYKRAGEELVIGSGIPYTVVRPGILSEGPFTGKGINDRLLRATTGTLKGVNLSNNDDISGKAARSTVAELLVQSFLIDSLQNRVLAIESTEDEGPGTDSAKWEHLIPASDT
eukprot:jgi/Ulvmu1/10001/UM059_0050.1